jgi:hypothetical protein
MKQYKQKQAHNMCEIKIQQYLILRTKQIHNNVVITKCT